MRQTSPLGFALPPERRAGLRDAAQAASAGYSLISWARPTPEQHLDQVAVLNRAGDDAPHDPSRQELVRDAARVRATDQRARVHGMLPGINETLGYHVIGKPERSWELPAAQVQA